MPTVAVNVKDVAALAGVSPKTVSNVVHDRPNVTESTRAAVKAAMQQLGYRPNLQARGLRYGRTNMLMLAIPDLSSPYFAELAHLIINVAATHGYTVLIEETGGVHEREVRVMHGAAALLVDGTIISPLALSIDDLEAVSSVEPIVLLGERIAGVGADHVAIDNVAAGRDAAMHLLRSGRHRFAVIGFEDDPSAATAQLRLRGVSEAIAADANPNTLLPPVSVTAFSRAAGAHAVDHYLHQSTPPDGLVCFNDELAIGAMRRCHELGFRVPYDVAIIGIDGIQETEFVTPTLSTIAPDKVALAQAALASLTRQIDASTELIAQDVVIPHRLIVRESTATYARFYEK